jgi:hypothetical protein
MVSTASLGWLTLSDPNHNHPHLCYVNSFYERHTQRYIDTSMLCSDPSLSDALGINQNFDIFLFVFVFHVWIKIKEIFCVWLIHFLLEREE